VFNPCQPVFHAAAVAVRRPFHHVAHRVIGRAFRRTSSHTVPLHATQPIPAACFHLPGVLPAGPGLAAPALGTLGGIVGLGAAALLSASMAAAGLGPSSGSRDASGTAGGSSPAATSAVFSGSAAGATPGSPFSAAAELFMSPSALNPGLSTVWFSGGETPMATTPISAWMPPVFRTSAPIAGRPMTDTLPVATPPVPDNTVPKTNLEHPTAVPEPASLALLAAGSVIVLFFRAVPRRRRGSSPSKVAFE